MAFTLNMKSVDGYFIGRCSPITTLTDATMTDTPGESTTSLVQLNFARYYDMAVTEWNSYYKPAITHLPNAGQNPMGNFINYLQDNGYTGGNNFLVVAAFDIVDGNGNVTGAQLCLCAFTAGAQQLSHYTAKRVRTQNGWTYTTISNVRTESLSDGFTDFGMIAGTVILSGHLYYGFGFGLYKEGEDTNKRAGAVLWGDTTSAFNTLMGGTVPQEETDPDLGPASEPGGYGPGGGGSGGPGPTFDGVSDPWIDYPKKPGIAALGLVNLYKCDVGSLVNLGAELFPDVAASTDIWTALTAFSDSIWNSKLIDYIISAHIIPIDVTSVGNLEDIKVGTRTLTGILARKISDDVIEFDCGTIHVDEFYTNFIDYRGTRCRIYLPFHGMVDIKPEYWQSADLQVKYLFNVIDGSFIAQIFSTVTRHQEPFKCLIGQYTGSACVHVPMTGASYSAMFSGMVANAGGMALGIAAGQPQVAATSALSIATGSMGNNGNMQMSNAYNASAGFYGHPCPYLIIERQISQFSMTYPKEQGLPLLVTKRIGSCSGLTICDNVILNFACSEDEAKEIINALKEGVIV